MTTLSTTNSAVICHCLNVTEAQVEESVDNGRLDSVKAVMDCTGAGSGCTACHRRIIALLRQKSSQTAYAPQS